MAKRIDSGELMMTPQGRRFPWRLWMYAILVTGGAGALGYFGWQYRTEAATQTEAAAKCLDNTKKLESTAADRGKQADECNSTLGNIQQKSKELETQAMALTSNLSASKEELATLRAQRAETEKRIAAIESIQKQFAKMVDTGQLRVTARHGSLVLSLPSEVLFASGSADVSDQGQVDVIQIAGVLKAFSDRRFLVLGHTDKTPLKSSTFKDNWELSTARALNVARILVKGHMEAKNLIPAGAGEYDPLGADLAKNRRIEIVLLPAINELPPLPKSLEEPKK